MSSDFGVSHSSILEKKDIKMGYIAIIHRPIDFNTCCFYFDNRLKAENLIKSSPFA